MPASIEHPFTQSTQKKSGSKTKEAVRSTKLTEYFPSTNGLNPGKRGRTDEGNTPQKKKRKKMKSEKVKQKAIEVPKKPSQKVEQKRKKSLVFLKPKARVSLTTQESSRTSPISLKTGGISKKKYKTAAKTTIITETWGKKKDQTNVAPEDGKDSGLERIPDLPMSDLEFSDLEKQEEPLEPPSFQIVKKTKKTPIRFGRKRKSETSNTETGRVTGTTIRTQLTPLAGSTNPEMQEKLDPGTTTRTQSTSLTGSTNPVVQEMSDPDPSLPDSTSPGQETRQPPTETAVVTLENAQLEEVVPELVVVDVRYEDLEGFHPKCRLLELVRLMTKMINVAIRTTRTSYQVASLSEEAHMNLKLSLKESSSHQKFFHEELQQYVTIVTKWMHFTSSLSEKEKRTQLLNLEDVDKREAILYLFWDRLGRLPNFVRKTVHETAFMLCQYYSGEFYTSTWRFGALKDSSKRTYESAFKRLLKLAKQDEIGLLTEIIQGKYKGQQLLYTLYGGLVFRGFSTIWLNCGVEALYHRLWRQGVNLDKLWPSFKGRKEAMFHQWSKESKPHGEPFKVADMQAIVQDLCQSGRIYQLWTALVFLILSFTGLRQERARYTKWDDISVTSDEKWLHIAVRGGKHQKENEVLYCHLPIGIQAFSFCFVLKLLRTITPDGTYIFSNPRSPQKPCTLHYWKLYLLQPVNLTLQRIRPNRRGITSHNMRHYFAYFAKAKLQVSEMQVAALLHHKLSKKKFPTLVTGRYVLSGYDYDELWQKFDTAMQEMDLQKLLLGHPRWKILWEEWLKHPVWTGAPFPKKLVQRIMKEEIHFGNDLGSLGYPKLEELTQRRPSR